MDAFTRAYLECALWSSSDQSTPSGGAPLDRNYDLSDIAPTSIASAEEEIADFLKQAQPLLDAANISDEQAGHDFWLTRNGHGAGFWDRGNGAIGEKLTKLCRPYGSSDAYVGDDGLIYLT